jgi:predicted enzyme related to lactoylglutathione lyase
VKLGIFAISQAPLSSPLDERCCKPRRARAMLRDMFCRYALRTIDVDGARRFYSEAIGLSLPPEGSSESSLLEVWPLHERARALGAPPHWLGQIAVEDVDRTADRLVELGSERLGPTVQARDGTPFATLRDPFGAVVGVRARGQSLNESPVEWHQLHTRDAEGAWQMYSELFGWVPKETIDAPEPIGALRLFAWRAAGKPVGSMGNTARLPGVHPHWLFFFPVADVEATAARVRALAGTAQEPILLPNGSCFIGCEDPQGAAFGLVRRA